MIDCHLHLQDPRLCNELEGIMETVRKIGISKLVVNGTHPEDWDAVERIALEFPEVIPSFGLHPWRVGSEREGWLEDLESRLLRHPDACIGEIGLDRWIRGSDFDRQKEVFATQLDLARRLGRPVSVHCLQAWGSLLEELTRTDSSGGLLLHSFGGPAEMIGEFASLGAFFSLSGYFFKPGKEAKLAVFDSVPRHRLLLETDAPDMLPPSSLQPFHLPSATGEDVNHPANLLAIYTAVAARYSLSPDALVQLMRDNFGGWFHGTSRRRDGRKGAIEKGL